MTTDQRAEAFERWKSNRSQHIAAGRAHLLGTTVQGLRVAVTSRGRYVAGPELSLVFHRCTAVPRLDQEDFDPELLVEPVLRRARSPWEVGYSTVTDFQPPDHPVGWSAADDAVTLTLTPDAFRPDARWSTDDDELCLLALDDGPSIRVTWTLTEEGVDAPVRGEFDLAVAAAVDARDLTRAMVERWRARQDE